MMSILPQASSAVWISAPGASGLVRSPPKTAVSPAISDADCAARSLSRSLMTTFAPCSLSSSAVARPMPRAEPVTIATLSSRTPMAVTIVGDPPIGGPPTIQRRPGSSRAGQALQTVRSPNHVEHDLVGPRADPVQAQIAPRPLDLVLAHIARAAKDLQAFVG